MMDRHVQNIKAKLAEKLTPIGKGDLFLADYEKLDSHTARVLIGYKLGEANRDDITNFVIRAFNGQLVPVTATLRFHPEKAASMVVRMFLPTRPLKDKKKMAQLTPVTYVDTLKNVWKVEEREGTAYLIRETQEDIGNILAERRKRMLVPGGSTPKFKTVTAGLLHVDAGDTVKYYHGGDERVGEVASVSKGQLKVKRPKGFHEVEIVAVTQVMEKSASLSAAEKKKLHDYYIQIYPADYVEALLKGA